MTSLLPRLRLGAPPRRHSGPPAVPVIEIYFLRRHFIPFAFCWWFCTIDVVSEHDLEGARHPREMLSWGRGKELPTPTLCNENPTSLGIHGICWWTLNWWDALLHGSWCSPKGNSWLGEWNDKFASTFMECLYIHPTDNLNILRCDFFCGTKLWFWIKW